MSDTGPEVVRSGQTLSSVVARFDVLQRSIDQLAGTVSKLQLGQTAVLDAVQVLLARSGGTAPSSSVPALPRPGSTADPPAPGTSPEPSLATDRRTGPQEVVVTCQSDTYAVRNGFDETTTCIVALSPLHGRTVQLLNDDACRFYRGSQRLVLVTLRPRQSIQDAFRVVMPEHLDGADIEPLTHIGRSWPGVYRAAEDTDCSVPAYEFPFRDMQPALCSQSHFGDRTHCHAADFYAVDFSVPLGTKVYCSRAGVVDNVKKDSNVGGDSSRFDNAANFVKILHEDGTVSKYYHLAYNGIAMRRGQAVAVGDLLGFTGNTGHSDGPHLHFGTTRLVDACHVRPDDPRLAPDGEPFSSDFLQGFLEEQSQPFMYRAANGHEYIPRQGTAYTEHGATLDVYRGVALTWQDATEDEVRTVLVSNRNSSKVDLDLTLQFRGCSVVDGAPVFVETLDAKAEGVVVVTISPEDVFFQDDWMSWHFDVNF
eukprot:TRINITY_DN4968_c0_g1_i1.p1 TRINITY_DN4968_c0_g1~~TRINITY_DN4968_c0_g1_i1.p1  ORF type:complete len:505 (-),score=78.63 TRINITY_DN4968_c0_g1_i1:88-1530(-)